MLSIADVLHENVHLGLKSKRPHDCERRISALLQGFTLTATWLCVHLWFTFCTASLVCVQATALLRMSSRLMAWIERIS